MIFHRQAPSPCHSVCQQKLRLKWFQEILLYDCLFANCHLDLCIGFESQTVKRGHQDSVLVKVTFFFNYQNSKFFQNSIYSWHQKPNPPLPRIHQFTNLKCCIKAKEPLKTPFLVYYVFLIYYIHTLKTFLSLDFSLFTEDL